MTHEKKYFYYRLVIVFSLLFWIALFVALFFGCAHAQWGWFSTKEYPHVHEISDYGGNLSTALADLDPNESIIINQITTISSNITIDTNLIFIEPGLLDINNSSVIISGQITGPMGRLFDIDATSSLSITGTDTIYSIWFNDDIADAVGALSSGAKLIINNGTHDITSAVTIATQGVIIEGISTSAAVRNTGAGACFVVTADYVTFRDLSICGNGGGFGAGASGTYGIDFNGASYCKLINCDIKNNGSHGVFLEGGIWCMTVDNCIIRNNGGDGINSLSNATYQNGNALRVDGSDIWYNGDDGIEWSAANLDVSGSVIEQNVGDGIIINSDDPNKAAYGFNISGNYFESNYNSAITLKSDSIYSISGGSISGNYIMSSHPGGGTYLVVANNSGAIRNTEINQNAYQFWGGTVTHNIYAPDLQEDCDVTGFNASSTTISIGSAVFSPASKTICLSGKIAQTGITYSNTTRSANISRTASDGYFLVSLPSGTYIKTAKIHVYTDSINYDVTLYVSGADQTGHNDIATISSQADTGNSGSQTITWNCNYRIPDNYIIYVRVVTANDATSSYMYLYNLDLTVY